jgi:hypothetical protein
MPSAMPSKLEEKSLPAWRPIGAKFPWELPTANAACRLELAASFNINRAVDLATKELKERKKRAVS